MKLLPTGFATEVYVRSRKGAFDKVKYTNESMEKRLSKLPELFQVSAYLRNVNSKWLEETMAYGHEINPLKRLGKIFMAHPLVNGAFGCPKDAVAFLGEVTKDKKLYCGEK